MNSRTSLLCKIVSYASLIVTVIMCIIKDNFLVKLQLATKGLLIALIFMALAVIIDKILKTMKEQKRIYNSIDALSEKINIMLGLDKTSVAIENLKAETAPIYSDAANPIITSEEDLTWNCPECDNVELSVNTVCTKCGYDKNEH